MRVEPDGEALIAGLGRPGSEVEILSDGEVIARAEVDADGAFIAIPDAPIPPGSHRLSVREAGATEAAGAEQQVAVVVPGAEAPGTPDQDAIAAAEPQTGAPVTEGEEQVAVLEPEPTAPTAPTADAEARSRLKPARRRVRPARRQRPPGRPRKTIEVGGAETPSRPMRRPCRPMSSRNRKRKAQRQPAQRRRGQADEGAPVAGAADDAAGAAETGEPAEAADAKPIDAAPGAAAEAGDAPAPVGGESATAGEPQLSLRRRSRCRNDLWQCRRRGAQATRG